MKDKKTKQVVKMEPSLTVLFSEKSSFLHWSSPLIEKQVLASSLHGHLLFNPYSLRNNIQGEGTTAKECVEFRMIKGVVKQSLNHLKSQNYNGIYYIAVTFGMQLV